MYLTSADANTISDLVKMIDSVLDTYNETPFDQIDNLRAKTCEISDIVESDMETGNENDSLEDLRQEQLQTNVYDFLDPIEN
jgi:hypothetical protein